MQVDLSCWGASLRSVLLDPSALACGDVKPSRIDDEAGRVAGHVLVIDTDEPELDLRVLVDEDPDPDAVAKAEKEVDGALLRVPSGKLVLRSPSEPRFSEAALTLRPGNYRVDAYSIEAVHPDTGYFEQSMGKATLADRRAWGRLSRLGWVLVILGSLLVAVGSETGVQGLRPPSMAVALLGCAFLALRWLPKFRRARESCAAAEAAFARRFPPAFLVLKRLSDGESLEGRTGAKFFVSS